MENSNMQNLDPNFVPDEYRSQYDVIELPSQGILYPNKKGNVKVEFLTTMDENILSSPNIVNNGKVVDILLERKVKELGFEVKDLLEGDRMAILLFLRATGLGEMYTQPVIDPSTNKVVSGEINLTSLKLKKLEVLPDDKGEFDWELPDTKQNIKFRLLTGRDEDEIEVMNTNLMERNKDDISQKITLRLERCIMEIGEVRDKMKISAFVKKMNILNSRKLRKYIEEIEPGVEYKTTATIQGGVEVDTFLVIRSNFLWPEL